MDFIINLNQFSANVSSLVSLGLGLGTLATIAFLGWCWSNERKAR